MYYHDSHLKAVINSHSYYIRKYLKQRNVPQVISRSSAAEHETKIQLDEISGRLDGISSEVYDIKFEIASKLADKLDYAAFTKASHDLDAAITNAQNMLSSVRQQIAVDMNDVMLDTIRRNTDAVETKLQRQYDRQQHFEESMGKLKSATGKAVKSLRDGFASVQQELHAHQHHINGVDEILGYTLGDKRHFKDGVTDLRVKVHKLWHHAKHR